MTKGRNSFHGKTEEENEGDRIMEKIIETLKLLEEPMWFGKPGKIREDRIALEKRWANHLEKRGE